MRSRLGVPLVAVPAALALLLGTVAVSWGTHLSSDVEGHTTLDQTICAKDPATSNCLQTSARDKRAYYDLRTAPGEPYTTRSCRRALRLPSRAARSGGPRCSISPS